jgi:hypothetical protein
LRDYSAEELDGEFLDLHVTYLALEGRNGETPAAFLDELRRRIPLKSAPNDQPE